MSYAIAFLAGVISAFAGIWLFVRWADAVETVEHRRKVLRDLISHVVVTTGRPRATVAVLPAWDRS